MTAMASNLRDLAVQRSNLRGPLLTGIARSSLFKGHDVSWLVKDWPILLDCHSACPRPGEAACLAEATPLLGGRGCRWENKTVACVPAWAERVVSTRANFALCTPVAARSCCFRGIIRRFLVLCQVSAVV